MHNFSKYPLLKHFHLIVCVKYTIHTYFMLIAAYNLVTIIDTSFINSLKYVHYEIFARSLPF